MLHVIRSTLYKVGSKKALEVLAIFVSAAQLAAEIWDALLVVHLCYKQLIPDIQCIPTALTLKLDNSTHKKHSWHTLYNTL